MILRDIAHARAGDKGDTAIIAVICRSRADYPRLLAEVTPERVRAHFAGIVQGDIRRREAPELGAVVFVLERALRGGVSTSLSTDPHGKSFSALMLSLPLGTNS
jgi:hypothetical protein